MKELFIIIALLLFSNIIKLVLETKEYKEAGKKVGVIINCLVLLLLVIAALIAIVGAFVS